MSSLILKLFDICTYKLIICDVYKLSLINSFAKMSHVRFNTMLFSHCLNTLKIKNFQDTNDKNNFEEIYITKMSFFLDILRHAWPAFVLEEIMR